MLAYTLTTWNLEFRTRSLRYLVLDLLKCFVVLRWRQNVKRERREVRVGRGATKQNIKTPTTSSCGAFSALVGWRTEAASPHHFLHYWNLTFLIAADGSNWHQSSISTKATTLTKHIDGRTKAIDKDRNGSLFLLLSKLLSVRESKDQSESIQSSWQYCCS